MKGRHRTKGAKPSASIDMTPEKAKTILHDKEVRGHPITEKQRGLFGAIANKGRARGRQRRGT